MKTLKFSTISGKTYQVQFDPNSFFDYMKRCGVANLNIKNQLSLYLNNLHESLLDAAVPYDSVMPGTIDFVFDLEFKNRYRYINEILIYNL
jgi:hypothetical protein